MMRCQKCRFWYEVEPIAREGKCRLRPPVLVDKGDAENKYAWQFPRTDAADWCGEFLPETTEHNLYLDEARREEREACARLIENELLPCNPNRSIRMAIAKAIRNRSGITPASPG